MESRIYLRKYAHRKKTVGKLWHLWPSITMTVYHSPIRYLFKTYCERQCPSSSYCNLKAMSVSLKNGSYKMLSSLSPLKIEHDRVSSLRKQVCKSLRVEVFWKRFKSMMKKNLFLFGHGCVGIYYLELWQPSWGDKGIVIGW